MSSLNARAVATVSAVAIAVATLSSLTSPASAIGKIALKVSYKASGTTYIKSTDSTVTLAQTKLTTGLDNNGYFKGSLPLKPAQLSGKIAGTVPVTATATFIPVGALTGRLRSNPTPRVSATAKYTIKLTNVVAVGLLPFPVGQKCTTEKPVSITVSTPKGKIFDLTKGGTVSGAYDLGQFANCGLGTGILNLFIPSKGNTVSFKLSDGKRIS